MIEDYLVLGMSKKQWNRYRKVCCPELMLPKTASALQVVDAIRKKTGRTTKEPIGSVIRNFYLKTRRERDRLKIPYHQRDNRTKTKHKPIGAPHPDYVKDDEFYKSRAWRELRLEALRNMRNCQACGRGPQHGIVLHVDHIQPRYRAPHLSLVLSNCQVFCEDCNVGKGAWDETDFRHFRSI